MLKPLFLIDLDDNVFQTKRKMKLNGHGEPYKTAALDRQLEPRSFMSQEQSHFMDWLLHNADVVPITARGTEETARVTIAFKSWKITTHGAVILTPSGDYDAKWKEKILLQLAPYQASIKKRQEILTKAFAAAGIDAWARINYEYDQTAIYLVAKHSDSAKIAELYKVADEVDEQLGLEGFYIHRNDNNIAWLPKVIEKGLAGEYLIQKIREQSPNIPIIGLGDSISDLSFLQHCSWFGMPKTSQLSGHIKSTLMEQ